PVYPLVDPRGLITPLQDGWSIDFWLFDANGNALVPSRLHDESVTQSLLWESQQTVATSSSVGEMALNVSTSVVMHDNQPSLKTVVRALSAGGGSLVVAIRPY